MAGFDDYADTIEGQRAADAANNGGPRTELQRLRSSTAYKTITAQFATYARGRDLPCAICNGAHGPIHYQAASHDPLSLEVHHLVSFTAHPELALSWTNLAATHKRCNRRHGPGRTRYGDDDDDTIDIGIPSEPW
jgi:hypothetical protein